MTEKHHYWSRCPMCGPVVICGKCGNNACNGGRGTLPDGSVCDACDSAYEKQKNNDGLPLWGHALELWLLVCAYAGCMRPSYLGWLYWRWCGMPEPRPWYTFRG